MDLASEGKTVRQAKKLQLLIDQLKKDTVFTGSDGRAFALDQAQTLVNGVLGKEKDKEKKTPEPVNVSPTDMAESLQHMSDMAKELRRTERKLMSSGSLADVINKKFKPSQWPDVRYIDASNALTKLTSQEMFLFAHYMTGQLFRQCVGTIELRCDEKSEVGTIDLYASSWPESAQSCESEQLQVIALTARDSTKAQDNYAFLLVQPKERRVEIIYMHGYQREHCWWNAKIENALQTYIRKGIAPTKDKRKGKRSSKTPEAKAQKELNKQPVVFTLPLFMFGCRSKDKPSEEKYEGLAEVLDNAPSQLLYMFLRINQPSKSPSQTLDDLLEQDHEFLSKWYIFLYLYMEAHGLRMILSDTYYIPAVWRVFGFSQKYIDKSRQTNLLLKRDQLISSGDLWATEAIAQEYKEAGALYDQLDKWIKANIKDGEYSLAFVAKGQMDNLFADSQYKRLTEEYGTSEWKTILDNSKDAKQFDRNITTVAEETGRYLWVKQALQDKMNHEQCLTRAMTLIQQNITNPEHEAEYPGPVLTCANIADLQALRKERKDDFLYGFLQDYEHDFLTHALQKINACYLGKVEVALDVNARGTVKGAVVDRKKSKIKDVFCPDKTNIVRVGFKCAEYKKFDTDPNTSREYDYIGQYHEYNGDEKSAHGRCSHAMIGFIRRARSDSNKPYVMEIIDSNGVSSGHIIAVTEAIEKAFSAEYNTFGNPFLNQVSVIPAVESCIRIGAQGISADSFCQMWSILMAFLQLTCPNSTTMELQQQLTAHGPEQLINNITNWMCSVWTYMYEQGIVEYGIYRATAFKQIYYTCDLLRGNARPIGYRNKRVSLKPDVQRNIKMWKSDWRDMVEEDQNPENWPYILESWIMPAIIMSEFIAWDLSYDDDDEFTPEESAVIQSVFQNTELMEKQLNDGSAIPVLEPILAQILKTRQEEVNQLIVAIKQKVLPKYAEEKNVVASFERWMNGKLGSFSASPFDAGKAILDIVQCLHACEIVIFDKSQALAKKLPQFATYAKKLMEDGYVDRFLFTSSQVIVSGKYWGDVPGGMMALGERDFGRLFERYTRKFE